MKKLLGFGVLVVIVYFAGTALLEEYTGSPGPEGHEEMAQPGLRDKAATAGVEEAKEREDKLNAITDE